MPKENIKGQIQLGNIILTIKLCYGWFQINILITKYCTIYSIKRDCQWKRVVIPPTKAFFFDCDRTFFPPHNNIITSIHALEVHFFLYMDSFGPWCRSGSWMPPYNIWRLLIWIQNNKVNTDGWIWCCISASSGCCRMCTYWWQKVKTSYTNLLYSEQWLRQQIFIKHQQRAFHIHTLFALYCLHYIQVRVNTMRHESDRQRSEFSICHCWCKYIEP